MPYKTVENCTEVDNFTSGQIETEQNFICPVPNTKASEMSFYTETLKVDIPLHNNDRK